MIRHRSFPTYAEYAWRQGDKARAQRDSLLARLPSQSVAFEQVFRAAAPHLHQKAAVLCLGARTGAEVVGATRAGFAGSVGIDLHPIGAHVLQADWHALPFAGGSFANVYTNSLDHCASLERLSAEVHRVLMTDGIFYVMASDRWPGKTVDAWLAKPNNEALYWQHADDLAAAIAGYGFALEASWQQSVWGHYILRRVPA